MSGQELNSIEDDISSAGESRRCFDNYLKAVQQN